MPGARTRCGNGRNGLVRLTRGRSYCAFPLAGEGGSILPRARMREGFTWQPLTRFCLRTYHCALSRKGRGHERREPRFWRNEPNGRVGGTKPTYLSAVVPAKAATHDHRLVVMGPGSTHRIREGSAGTTILVRANNQPAGVGNRQRRALPVSGLFFTGSPATSTCLLIARAYVSSRRCGRMGPCGVLRRGLGWALYLTLP